MIVQLQASPVLPRLYKTRICFKKRLHNLSFWGIISNASHIIKDMGIKKKKRKILLIEGLVKTNEPDLMIERFSSFPKFKSIEWQHSPGAIRVEVRYDIRDRPRYLNECKLIHAVFLYACSNSLGFDQTATLRL